MSDWSSSLLPTVVAAMLLLAPGAVVGALLRLRGLALLGLAAPLSIAVIGGSAVLAALVGLPFGPLVPALGTVLAAALALAARRFVPAPHPEGRGIVLATAVAAALSALAAAVVAFGGIASPSLVSQTYDGVFHLNAVAWVLDRGDASSFHLYRLAHPGEDIEFYPAAWHALAALVCQITGASVPVATNAVWIASVGAISALGAAFLAVTVLPAARNRPLVAVTATLAASATAAAPYLLLRWGVLYPTWLAYALLPAGLALTVLAVRELGTRRVLLPGSLLAVWVVSSAFAHPRSLVSYALLVVPLLAGAVLVWAGRGLRTPRLRRRTALVLGLGSVALIGAIAVGSVAVLRYFNADERPVSERLNGGPATARQTLGESLLQALTLAPPSGPGESTLPVTVVVAAAVLAGLLVALLRPGARWIAVAYLAAAVLYALAAGSNEDFAKIATGFWYKDKYRLFALLGVLAPVLLAVLADAIDRSARRLRVRPAVVRLLSPAALALVVLAGWFGPTLAAMQQAIPLDWRIEEQKDGRLLDRSAYALLSELPSLVEPGTIVAGNPWNGSSLTWAIGGREALFPHLTGQWDPDRVTVATRLDQIGSDPEVCAALERLGVGYVMASDGLLWGGDPQAEFFAAIDRAVSGPGFELVDEQGTARLYRVVGCR